MNKKYMYIGLAVLALAGLAVGGYYLAKKRGVRMQLAAPDEKKEIESPEVKEQPELLDFSN